MTPSRREFLQATGAVGAVAMASRGSRPVHAGAQTVMNQESRTVQTAVLNIGYEESGRSDGFPIVLLHGFPSVSYTHLRSPRDLSTSRMPSSA